MDPNSPANTPNQIPNPTPEDSRQTVASNSVELGATASSDLKLTPPTESSTTPSNPKTTLSANSTIQSSSKPKPFYKQWQFYVMLVLGIAAVAGWIFGAHGIGEGNAALAKVAGLENEIAEKNQLLVKYGTELGYKVDQYGRPIQEEKPPASGVQTAVEDIYIAEWGLKFKIPSQLKNVSYMYSGVEYYTETINRSTDVCVTGMPSEATGQPGFADLRHIGWAGLGCLGRFPIETEGEIVSEEWYQAQRESAVYEDEKYYYVFSGPQAVYSGDPTEQKWETKATQLVREMLTKNMSTFKVK